MGLQSASGGLTTSKLRLATASASDVVSPKTFYSGDKTLKTGAMTDFPQFSDSVVSVDRNDENAKIDVRIRPGAYRNTDSSGYSTVRGMSTLFNAVVSPESISQWSAVLSTSGGKLSHTFPLYKGEVIMFVLHGACTDRNAPSLSLTTPNCTTLMNYDSGVYTQDMNYMQNQVLIRVVLVNSNGTASATVTGAGTRAVGFMGAWRLVHDNTG